MTSARVETAPANHRAATLLDRSEIAPRMVDRPVPALDGGAFTPVTFASAPPDRLNLLGVIEAPLRDMRLVVVSMNGQIAHGREGSVIGGRYRVGEFTDRDADLLDIANEEPIHLVATIEKPSPPPPPAQIASGALRVVGEPASAEIYVDGAYVGTVAEMSSAPDGVPLEPGAHDVDLQAPEYQSVRLAVRISPKRTTTYRVALPKER